MDPQLNSLYELTKTDMQDFMQECYEYCVSEYNRGQDEITKQVLIFCQQQGGGDLRKVNLSSLLNFLIQKRNEITGTEVNGIRSDSQQISQNKKVLTSQLQNQQKSFITINHERLQQFYQDLD